MGILALTLRFAKWCEHVVNHCATTTLKTNANLCIDLALHVPVHVHVFYKFAHHVHMYILWSWTPLVKQTCNSYLWILRGRHHWHPSYKRARRLSRHWSCSHTLVQCDCRSTWQPSALPAAFGSRIMRLFTAGWDNDIALACMLGYVTYMHDLWSLQLLFTLATSYQMPSNRSDV